MVAERLDGVLVVDKPAGMTSHDVVAIVRRAVRRVTGATRKATKVGHAGTLDPMATGVLVVCIGKATRLVPYLQASRKTYDTEIVLGVSTTTLDAQGEVVSEHDASGIDEPALCDALKRFVGDIEQVPPMVSALKVGGERLYEKARRGESVERPPRPVTIHELVLESFEPGERARAAFLVTCSTGTYVRSLAADIGDRLGVGGHVSSLRRLASGRFDLAGALAPDEVERRAADGSLPESVLPMAAAVADFPARQLDEAEAADLRHGRSLGATGCDGPVAAIGPAGDLLAMIADDGGRAKPLAVLAP